jgi:hypothetical protein
MFYGKHEHLASMALEEGVAPSFLGRLKKPKLPKAPKKVHVKQSRFAQPEAGSVQTCPTGTAYGPLPGSDLYNNPQFGCVVTGTNAPTLAQQVKPQVATGYGSQGGGVVYGPSTAPQGSTAAPASAGSWAGGPAVTPWGAVPSPSGPTGGGWTPPQQGSSLFPGGGGGGGGGGQCPAGTTFCPPNLCCPAGSKCDPHGVCCPFGMDYDPKAGRCCIVDAGGRCLQVPAGGGGGGVKPWVQPPIIVPGGGGFPATFVPGSSGGDSYDYEGGGISAFEDKSVLILAAVGLLAWCLVKR